MGCPSKTRTQIFVIIEVNQAKKICKNGDAIGGVRWPIDAFLCQERTGHPTANKMQSSTKRGQLQLILYWSVIDFPSRWEFIEKASNPRIVEEIKDNKFTTTIVYIVFRSRTGIIQCFITIIEYEMVATKILIIV